MSTSDIGYWGSNYQHDGNTGKGSKSATFTPTLPAACSYQVYLWYTAAPNRANNVPVDIVHADGTSSVTVNQQINGSQWFLLGTYTFNAARAATSESAMRALPAPSSRTR